MTEREALKLALDALELNNSEWKDLENSGDSGYWKAEDQGHYQLTIEAITAIKEALAQPKQEPVAWFRYETVYEYKNQLARCTKDCIGAFPVYTFPPKRESEPVIDKSAAIRIATSLGWEPKRKPLTDAEIKRIAAPLFMSHYWNLCKEFARAIEAAHGIFEDKK